MKKMKLFEPTKLGHLELKNKFVMAPMTRSRAINNLPNELIAQYYTQRSGAGLIITEGISPSPNGLGYARIPGLFTKEQAQGWRAVTDSVHAKGAKIFVQLMHTGRVSHELNMPPGTQVLAPSAIALTGEMWTDQKGNQPHSTPKEMSADEIEQTIQEYVNSAELAVHVAGFDGVELHAANGYLIDQFLNPGSNQRGDIYGKDRTAFALEIATRVSKSIGNHKTGIRISPYGVFNDMASMEKTDEFYAQFANRLWQLGLAYIHVVDHGKGDVKGLVRQNFKGTYILSTGYDIQKAEVHLTEGHGDLVAFGRPFIANPDFVERVRQGLPMQDMDATKLYTPGPEGYIDYPSKVV
jgi:N-ethylmaleimide reductase